MTVIKTSLSNNLWIIPTMILVVIAIMINVFFPQAWMFLVILGIPLLIFGLYLFFEHPRFLVILFLVVLPFYPLTIFTAEKILGLEGNSVYLLRGIRDFFITLIFLWLLVKNVRRNGSSILRVRRLTPLIIFLFTYPIAQLFLTSGLNGVALFSLRDSLIYLVMYFIGLWIFLSYRQIHQLSKGIVLSSTMISIFGLIQAYILGPAFLSKFRSIETIFVSAPGFFGVQRAVGTFAHPTELGLYLVIVCGLVIWFMQTERRSLYPRILYLLIMGLLLVTIAATFSRSSWIALFVMLLVIFRGPKIIKLFGIIIPLLLVLVLLSPISKYILDSLQGREPSFNYHVQTLAASLNFLLQHPWGVGLGKLGVVALRLGSSTTFFEGFYFNLAGELGWVYLGFYWIFLIRVFINLLHCEKQTNDPIILKYIRCIEGAFLGWAITGFFLPSLTSREIAFTIWFLIGSTLSLSTRPYNNQSVNQ